jgi:hypothetical protein
MQNIFCQLLKIIEKKITNRWGGEYLNGAEGPLKS